MSKRLTNDGTPWLTDPPDDDEDVKTGDDTAKGGRDDEVDPDQRMGG